LASSRGDDGSDTTGGGLEAIGAGGAGGGGGTSRPKSAAKLSQFGEFGFGRAGGSAAFRRGGSNLLSVPIFGFGASTDSGGVSAPSSRASSSHLDGFSGFSIFNISLRGRRSP